MIGKLDEKSKAMAIIYLGWAKATIFIQTKPTVYWQ